MRPLDARLLRHAATARRHLVTCVVLGSATAGLVIAQATLVADLLAAGFVEGAGLAALGGPMTALAGVLLARAVLAAATEWAGGRASTGVRSELRQRLLAHTVRLGPRWLAGQRSGELATLATRGIDALDPYIARYLPQLVLAAVVPAAVGARILLDDWLSAVIVGLTVPLVPLFMALVGLHTRARTQRQWRRLAVLAHHFVDVTAGLATLKAYGRTGAQVRTIRAMTERYRAATMGTLRVAFLSALVLELLSTLSVALVAVSVGLRLLSGGLDLRVALLVLILAPEVFLPLRALGAQYHASAEGLAAAGRVLDILQVPPPPVGTGRPPTDRPLAVRLDRVTVTGRDGPVLDRFDLTVPAGSVVGLVGPSGAGKSTVVDLLLGFCRPDAGRVTAGDGSAAVDVADLDPDRWRSLIAWVPQRPRLVSGTVADNIRLGAPTADARAVVAAAEATAVDVPLDRLIDEGGAGLSTGQQRRVALARALLTDRPVLLLDEPTESLDGPTEDAVLDALAGCLRGRTALVVTHRPAPLRLCDHVVTLDAARAAVPA
jgi:ATP-binding cassette subfamily C protein CydCD